MIYKRNLIFILSLLLCGNVCAREKSDIIWLLNGDRITGEIKQLEHGILRVSTDSLGNVSVQWEDIAKIDSDYAFQFERSDGARITGQILKTEDQKKIQLNAGFFNCSYFYSTVTDFAKFLG